ncbi:unnamed protein product [Caenorhabditis auriculariae]|uniref:Uncharacterized protein n=1 Tax=Caenorhabditis auriculariae TaxID=2777116 RepID=A0A8S1H9Q8_9PELO|nr:unnamed protein product [Caenorhabditis auriculariae]
MNIEEVVVKEECPTEEEEKPEIKIKEEVEDDRSTPSNSEQTDDYTPIMSQKGLRLFYDAKNYEYRFCNAKRDCTLVGRIDVPIRCTTRHCKGKAVCLRSEDVILKAEHDPPHAPPVGKKERRVAIGRLKLDRMSGVTTEDAVRSVVATLPKTNMPSKSALTRIAQRASRTCLPPIRGSTSLGIFEPHMKSVLSRPPEIVGSFSRTRGLDSVDAHQKMPEGSEKKVDERMVTIYQNASKFRQMLARPLDKPSPSITYGDGPKRISIIGKNGIRSAPYPPVATISNGDKGSVKPPGADALAELVRQQAHYLLTGNLEGKFNELWSGIIECVDKSNKS